MPGFGSNTATTANTATSTQEKKPLKAIDTIVDEVIRGEWGSGDERKQKLVDAGYSYEVIQGRVNRKLSSVKSLDDVATEVIRGVWGNGAERKQRLEAAGYNFNEVQSRVNAKINGSSSGASGNLDEVARKVIRGEFGNGAERKQRLEAAGYDFNAVQARVNQLMK